MKNLLLHVFALSSIAVAFNAGAASDYNNPGSDKVYLQCLKEADKRYEGGRDWSPISGQTKVQAWCTCMWNETPEEFKGSLVKFSELPRGSATNKLCEKHSNWSE